MYEQPNPSSTDSTSRENAARTPSARPDRWRVILVGRTGLDQTLRRHDSVELIRTRDTLDAIGELSDPIDVQSPDHAAVIVAPDADPGERERPHFIGALREVDPKVRALSIGPDTKGYDANVSPLDSADAILRTIEHAKRIDPIERLERAQEPEQSKRESTAPTPSAPASELSPSTTEPRPDESNAGTESSESIHERVLTGSLQNNAAASPSGHAPLPMSVENEKRILDALGDGRPIRSIAMDLIRERLGRNDLRFDELAERAGVPVSSADHVWGTIASDDESWMSRSGTSALKPHAAWLGAWLRLEAQQRELRLSAFTDDLTGAWNRRYFSRFLAAAIERSRTARQTLTLLYFDIDDFKGYNDAHGHEAGDEILVEVVKLLSSVIRPNDRVCRIGGDEFVVVFYEPEGPRDPSSAPPESIYKLATRFQQQVCAHNFPKLGDDAQGTLTISGGLASYPWDGADADSLLRVADELALHSKRQGKNVITLGKGAEDVCRVRPE